jgi:hypothetical protein
MLTNTMPKNAEKYSCDICDFKCSKISNYNTHISTAKHKRLTNIDTENDKNAPKFKCECGKEYNHRQSLSIHKKKCNITIVTDSNAETVDKDQLIMMLIKQNAELMKETTEFKHMMMDVIKTYYDYKKNIYEKLFNIKKLRMVNLRCRCDDVRYGCYFKIDGNY